MRTTLTLDDRIEQQIKELAVKEKSSFKALANELLKLGLEARENRPVYHFSVDAEDCGFREGIDPDKLNQIYDDLETQG